MGIIIARVLSLPEYGQYSIVLNTLLSISAIAQFAIGQTVTKYLAQYRETDQVKSGNIVMLCAQVSTIMALVGTILLIIFAPLISTQILESPSLSPILILGAGFLLFATINGYQMGALAGLEAYKALAKAAMVSAIMTILGIGFSAWFFGLSGAIIALSLTTFFRFLVHYFFLKRELSAANIVPHYFGGGEEKNIFYRFAIPAAAAGLYSTPAIWLANSILVREGGFEQMALFSAAFSIRALVLFVPNVINTVGLSILNNMKGRGDQAKYARIYLLNVIAIFIVTTSVVVVIAIFGDYALSIFGKNFSHALPVLWALLLATVPEGLSIGLFQYLQSNEKIWLSLFFINIPRETLLVLLALNLTPTYGALGLAYAYVLVYTIALGILLLLIFILKRQVRNTLPGVL